MLESCHSAKDRWGGVNEIIDRWLAERQELILLYVAIEGLEEYTPKDTPISVKIQAFCQVMMDYVSAGHFEVYEQLLREAQEFDDGGVEIAKELYPLIEATTELIIRFNDEYDTDEHCQKMLGKLPDELSKLGQILEERFELEDRLIEVLHNAHKEMVS